VSQLRNMLGIDVDGIVEYCQKECKDEQ